MGSSAPNRPILLCSLGTSWAVVPEAFHLLPPGPEGFAAVHVLTTASPEVDAGTIEIERYFGSRSPAIPFSIDRVAEFRTFQTEEDHYRFEEVLYRWILDRVPCPTDRYICLSGGFKTMSAAVQKAAAVLGAREVFHVLADVGIRTADAVERAVTERKLRYIRLGPEPGWPQLRSTAPAEYPLETVSANGPVRFVRAEGKTFRDHVRALVERSHRISGAWARLPQLPFADLATWPESSLDWLQQPFDRHADSEWVRNLPKIELHCHLGGFATGGTDLAEVRAAALDPRALPAIQALETPPGWPRPEHPCGLETYMRLGDNNGSALLRDPGCLQRQCELLYDRLIQDRVVYAEIRCSPNNYAVPDDGRGAFDVLREIRETFQRRMEAPAASCHINLLIIATRKNAGDRSDISRHLALAVTAADQWRDPGTCRVVGVDLAGFESKETRAALFQADFEPIHRVGLAVTVHAGENDDAEGIWQAVFKLSARRLGHALHLDAAPDLLRAVADRGIGVEMCPYANLQIVGFGLHENLPLYPLARYLGQGVRVTVNTDNLGISGASLSENLLLLADLCPGISRLDLLRLQRNALEAAFIPASVRSRILQALTEALPRP